MIAWLQVNEEGPGKSRARRWARVFHKSTCTWPEILRRYLLATRAKTGIPQAQLTTPDPHLSLLPDHVAAVKGALQLAAKPWYRCALTGAVSLPSFTCCPPCMRPFCLHQGLFSCIPVPRRLEMLYHCSQVYVGSFVRHGICDSLKSSCSCPQVLSRWHQIQMGW